MGRGRRIEENRENKERGKIGNADASCKDKDELSVTIEA